MCYSSILASTARRELGTEHPSSAPPHTLSLRVFSIISIFLLLTGIIRCSVIIHHLLRAGHIWALVGKAAARKLVQIRLGELFRQDLGVLGEH